MSFYGRSFVFDGIPSETFNLSISSPDGGEVQTTGSNSVQLYTQTIYRRPKPYLFGVQQTPTLEFEISINSEDELTAQEAQRIQRWLFGHNDWKKLQIMQYDLQDIYFNCILNNPQVKRVGNLIVGFACTVVCDAPFAWLFPKTITKTYGTETASETFYFDNLSDNNFYLYPQLEFTMNTSGGDLSIVNVTDDNREFLIEDLSPLEVITMDCDLQIITSSTGLRRLSLFNKNWLRLVPNRNTLILTGKISELNITYQFARKIGG